jgi:hypothetical protein
MDKRGFLLLHLSRSQKRRLQKAQGAIATDHADTRTKASNRCDLLRRLEARRGRRGIPLRVALVDQQHIVARCEDVSAGLVLGSLALGSDCGERSKQNSGRHFQTQNMAQRLQFAAVEPPMNWSALIHALHAF